MNAQPIRKDIMQKCISLGVTEFTLEFSGGSDEGNLHVSITPSQWDLPSADPKHTKLVDLVRMIEDWAWDEYRYSGAGDGNDYGDNITYDIERMKVFTQEWMMQRVDGLRVPEKFEVAVDNKKD